jgi:hypothetical protein
VKCKECQQELRIANSKLASDKDSTDVYSELTLVCINPKCNSYAGQDLNNPVKFETVRNKAN